MTAVVSPPADLAEPRVRRRVARTLIPLRRVGLRARLTISFALGGALLSLVLSLIAWGLTRENLLTQKEDAAVSRVVTNAVTVRNGLSPTADIEQLLGSLPTPAGSQPVIEYKGDWHAKNAVAFGEQALPSELQATVIGGDAAVFRYVYDGEPYLAVGVPIPSQDAAYFEGVSLIEVQDALDGLVISLLGASVLTTFAGGLLGFWASRRVLEPLTDVGRAATAIAGGELNVRLEEEGDADLDPIITSFNEMAETLEQRLERDARFASEVSHELRSPLMTLAASVEVLENSRDELPERAQTALDLLKADVDRFQTLVEDLLEISRIDVGAVKLFPEEVFLPEIVIQAVSAAGTGPVPVIYEDDASEVVVRVDKRRFGRIVANLLDNARKYAGGATAVRIEVVPADDEGPERAHVVVEDEGAGVPVDERQLVFGRFSRGSESGNRASDTGVGLGLALVDEHVKLHGGRVWVEDRADGRAGARFVVELPVVPE
ncbi:MAG: HAMP domain-containing histidine kinase [Acidimicrobiales bacterium]|nr:HAMP domain-containing histidine kinase [Acidimicrobiales bacterium]